MNSFSIDQVSTVLNAIVTQATGQANLTAITTPAQFVSVAQTTLKTGYDPIINAISQVWSRTIFAERAYTGIGNTLYMEADKFGNATRKLSPVAGSMGDDLSYKYPVAYDAGETVPMGNGESVDHYKINKQEVVQTNFYGSGVYQQRYTIFKNQFDVAFTSPDEFMRFNAMNLTERNNDKVSFEEATVRGLQANFIGALIDENSSDRVVHLLTEYNTLTGQSLTASDIYKEANFPAFIRWCYSRIKTLIRMMGRRSDKYQTNLTGKVILRHTPADMVRVALYAPFMEMINSMVLSTTFNDEYMKLPTYEAIDFWQSIDTPQSISITPVYTGANGAQKSGNAVSEGDVVGFIHDKRALGYTIVDKWSATTPLNIDGGYWNEAHHARFRTLSDVTEKGIVLLLD